MNESKIMLTERLRREGRWEDASRFRDEKRKEFRTGGMTRAQAREAAWVALAVAFPPLPTSELPPAHERHLPGDIDLPGLHRRRACRVPEWLGEDISAVGDSIYGKPPAHFNSIGMYGLWRWAASNREDFERMQWADEGSDEMLLHYEYSEAMSAAEGQADEHQCRREHQNGRLEKYFANAFVARMDNTLDLLQARYPEFAQLRSWTCRLVGAIAPVVQRHVSGL